jgi:hypothetical protein
MRTYARIAGFLVVAAMLSGISIGTKSALAQGHKNQGHESHMREHMETVLEGEVVDLHCFMKHDEMGMGPDHAKCAQQCIGKGMPVGFLSNGEVFLLLGPQHETVGDMVADFCGVRSLVSGKVVEHHGLKAIEVGSIMKAPARK